MTCECCVSAGNENYTGIAARDTANALAVLAHAVRGVAAGTSNAQTQAYILTTAQQVRVVMCVHACIHACICVCLCVQ